MQIHLQPGRNCKFLHYYIQDVVALIMLLCIFTFWICNHKPSCMRGSLWRSRLIKRSCKLNLFEEFWPPLQKKTWVSSSASFLLSYWLIHVSQSHIKLVQTLQKRSQNCLQIMVVGQKHAVNWFYKASNDPSSGWLCNNKFNESLVLVWFVVTSHSATFQLYSDRKIVQFPNLDLLPGSQCHGQLGVFSVPSLPRHGHRDVWRRL